MNASQRAAKLCQGRLEQLGLEGERILPASPNGLLEILSFGSGYVCTVNQHVTTFKYCLKVQRASARTEDTGKR